MKKQKRLIEISYNSGQNYSITNEKLKKLIGIVTIGIFGISKCWGNSLKGMIVLWYKCLDDPS